MSATERLDALHQRLAETRAREREIPAARAEAEARVRSLEERLAESDLPLGELPPAGSPARKLWNELDKARVLAAGPWDAMAQRAAQDREEAEADLARFVAENAGPLFEEIEPDADHAQAAIETASGDLLAAIESWHEVGQRSTALLRYVPGLDGRDVPAPPCEPVRVELRRLLAQGVPRPLPRTFFPVEPAEGE